MKVTKTVKSPTLTQLDISADAADLEPIKKHVLSHFVDRVKVPGFRAGKAPLNMVEKNVDQRVLLDEFMEHAINELYNRALREQGLRPVSQPNVKLKKFVPYTDMEFELEVDTLGEIKLPNYKTMKLAKPQVTVAAKDVNEVLESLRKRVAERQEVDQAAKDGDEVVIDFSGKDEAGKPINGTDGKDYPLVLGSGSFIPGFEEQLAGMKAGEAKSFEVTFPKDYGVAAMQGKKVTFDVTVKKVNQVVLPKLDDELAPKVGPFKTLADLKEDVKKQIQQERESQSKTQYENEIIRKIVDKTTVDIPDSMVEEQLERMERNEKQNLMYQGKTWEEHLTEEGISDEEHKNRHRPEAAERVKGGLVLSEIAEQEKLTVTPEEMELRLQVLRSQYQDPAMQAELAKPENQRDIMAQMLTEKTVDKLVEYLSE
jgi:trigger factor